MNEINKLSDFDVMFFYGQNDLALENSSDVMAGIIQPKRSLYYNRQDGCGVSDRENYPNSIILVIGIRYDIIKWVSYRNNQVSEDSPDRRVAVSQSVIEFKQDNKGNLDVNVKYIPFADINSPDQLSVPIGI